MTKLKQLECGDCGWVGIVAEGDYWCRECGQPPSSKTTKKYINEEKIKEILTNWSGKTLSSNEQFNQELEKTLQEYGQWVRQQTLEEAIASVPEEKEYSERISEPSKLRNHRELGHNLCCKQILSNLQALKDKN